MIPRLKPFIGDEEVFSIFKTSPNAVKEFEQAFAKQFDSKYATAFPYGRSALWAFFKALGLNKAEIAQPAYTCSVVAHATVLSGNIPVFVDNNLGDYTMDMELLEKAITPNTRAIIPTHLFGYPMDVDEVNNIVSHAEKNFGHKIWVIQDCAHSFATSHKGKSVINTGDGAIFGLGISKQITSIFGGIFSTNNLEIANKIIRFQEEHFTKPTLRKSILRFLYLLAVYPAFSPMIYGWVYWLQERTALLNRLTKAYHLDEKIHFPPDYLDLMTGVEAKVGLEQIQKYAVIKKRRVEIAEQYFNNIPASNKYVLPKKVNGATYSHFVIRTAYRDQMLAYFALRGIQLGRLIEYSMPHHPAYIEYTNGKQFPNSSLCSHSMINLPIHPGLSEKDISRIISTLEDFTNS